MLATAYVQDGLVFGQVTGIERSRSRSPSARLFA